MWLRIDLFFLFVGFVLMLGENSCWSPFSLRKQLTFHDATIGFCTKMTSEDKHKNSILVTFTTQISSKFLLRQDQSEAVTRSGWWHIISMEFFQSLLKHHFSGNQWWHREMSAFLKLITIRATNTFTTFQTLKSKPLGNWFLSVN